MIWPIHRRKSRKGRRSFLNDFKADDSGQYSYMGNVHVYEGSVPYRTERQRIIILTVLMCAAAAAIGCIPAPSMLGYNNFYVVPFFIIELVAVFVTAWAAFQLRRSVEHEKRSVVLKTPAKAGTMAEDDGVFPSVGEEPAGTAGENAPQD